MQARKGGTTKTTTAVSVGAELAVLGERVALMDCDPQASATFALGRMPALNPGAADRVLVRLRNGAVITLFPGGRGLEASTLAGVTDRIGRARAEEPGVLIIDTPPASDR